MDTRSIKDMGYQPFNELAGKLHIKKGKRYYHAISQGREPADYDDEKFVKIFPEGMSCIYQLSLNSFRLLMAVIESVSEQARHKDEIYINLKCAREKLSKAGVNLTETSWQRARDQLVDKEIIIKRNIDKRCSRYYINPTIIFNGNRTKYMKSVIDECVEYGRCDYAKADIFLEKKIDELSAEIERAKIELEDLINLRNNKFK